MPWWQGSLLMWIYPSNKITRKLVLLHNYLLFHKSVKNTLWHIVHGRSSMLNHVLIVVVVVIIIVIVSRHHRSHSCHYYRHGHYHYPTKYKSVSEGPHQRTLKNVQCLSCLNSGGIRIKECKWITLMLNLWVILAYCNCENISKAEKHS
jgi:hypothetical protein